MGSIEAGTADNGPEHVFRHHLHHLCGTTENVNTVQYLSQKYVKFPIPQCKTSIGNNPNSIKDRAMKLVYSRWFSAMADRMV